MAEPSICIISPAPKNPFGINDGNWLVLGGLSLRYRNGCLKRCSSRSKTKSRSWTPWLKRKWPRRRLYDESTGRSSHNTQIYCKIESISYKFSFLLFLFLLTGPIISFCTIFAFSIGFLLPIWVRYFRNLCNKFALWNNLNCDTEYRVNQIFLIKRNKIVLCLVCLLARRINETLFDSTIGIKLAAKPYGFFTASPSFGVAWLHRYGIKFFPSFMAQFLLRVHTFKIRNLKSVYSIQLGE